MMRSHRISLFIAENRNVAIFALLLAALCAPLPARAQTPGELSGSVYDQTGAVLADVRVRVQGSTPRDVRTGADGSFQFPALPEGDYEVSAELSMFETAHRSVHVRTG